MSLSIVIPAFNEEKFIEETIKRITEVLREKLPYEIIIVDNFSNDRTAEILSRFDNIHVIKTHEKVTVSAARNLGWREAQHRVIAFIDADVLLTNDWVNRLVEVLPALHKDPLQITGYRYVLSEQPGWIETSWFKCLTASTPSYINSGNLITTREVLDVVEGFDSSLITGEDVDFCERAQAKGIRLNLDKGFIAHHEGYPKSLRDFYVRERWHGVGDLKSIHTFLKSKVAIFSFFSTALLFLSLLTLLFNKQFSVALVLLCVLFNFVVVLYRFKVTRVMDIPKLVFLQLVYCSARFFSIVQRTRI